MTGKIFSLLLLLTPWQVAFPCSSFVLKNENTVILGKNFDWTFGGGYILKNPRNTNKTAYFTHSGAPAAWTSKYGSVTFNQNGKEMPYGGMNEMGLVAEMLWLGETSYNLHAGQDYVNELEWIQYQLDNYASVEEVVQNIGNLKIYPIKGKIHYLLADAAGNSAIVEYIKGKPLIYHKDANTCQAITNKSVQHSAKYIDNLKNIRKKNTSETFRYHQLEKQISRLDPAKDISEKTAFRMLKSVAIAKGSFRTLWSVVYHISDMKIAFHTEGYETVKTIHLHSQDFDRDITFFELNQDGEVALDDKMKPFSEKDNFAVMSASLVHLGFDNAFTRELSRFQFDQTKLAESQFSKNYFHFDVTVPLAETGKRFVFAIMDSEETFEKRTVVPGGYFRLTTIPTDYSIHIYGLRNGVYSLFAHLDDNRNDKLDFDSAGKPLEKYSTFADEELKSGKNITFQNTSGYFDQSNSTLKIKWR